MKLFLRKMVHINGYKTERRQWFLEVLGSYQTNSHWTRSQFRNALRFHTLNVDNKEIQVSTMLVFLTNMQLMPHAITYILLLPFLQLNLIQGMVFARQFLNYISTLCNLKTYSHQLQRG